MYKLFFLMIFVISSNVFANQENPNDELDVTLENIRINNDIPALAVAIITSGEVTYIKGFGFLDENRLKPVTKESLFRIASVSKLFTAQAIMQLVEQGKLGLDDTIDQYLPVFRNTKITIRQLLTHSSGLSDSVRPLNFEHERSEQSYLKLVESSAINNLQDNKFEYSDTGFNILGSVISVVSGVKFENYINNSILLPAGMKRSGYFNSTDEHTSEAPPTYKGNLIDKTEQRPYDSSFNPSEGLVSNVVDLSHWLQLTLAQDASILKESTYTQMLEPQVKTVWGEIFVGLGWQVYKSEGATIARHPGSIRGYKSLVLSYPESENALILLTNSSNTPRWDIAKAITETMKKHARW